MVVVHQQGFENTVSPMGTALTEAQMRALTRYARRYVLALDPDAAGVKGHPARHGGRARDRLTTLTIWSSTRGCCIMKPACRPTCASAPCLTNLTRTRLCCAIRRSGSASSRRPSRSSSMCWTLIQGGTSATPRSKATSPRVSCRWLRMYQPGRARCLPPAGGARAAGG